MDWRGPADYRRRGKSIQNVGGGGEAHGMRKVIVQRTARHLNGSIVTISSPNGDQVVRNDFSRRNHAVAIKANPPWTTYPWDAWWSHGDYPLPEAKALQSACGLIQCH